MTVPLIVLAALSVLGGVMLLGDWIVDFLAPVVGTPVHDDPPVPALVVTLMVVAVVAVGVATAWFLVGKRPVPKTAPQDVSFATRAARVDLYGDAINEGLVVDPGRHLISGLLTHGQVRRRRRRSPAARSPSARWPASCARSRTASSAPMPCPSSAASCSSSWPCWR